MELLPDPVRPAPDIPTPAETAEPNIPIKGSTAAETRCEASVTFDIASSISFTAASLLFACGLFILSVECMTFIIAVPS